MAFTYNSISPLVTRSQFPLPIILPIQNQSFPIFPQQYQGCCDTLPFVQLLTQIKMYKKAVFITDNSSIKHFI